MDFTFTKCSTQCNFEVKKGKIDKLYTKKDRHLPMAGVNVPCSILNNDYN